MKVNDIAFGPFGLAERGAEGGALSISLAPFHVREDGAVEEPAGYQLCELTLVDIAREELLTTVIDTDVDDVVVIDLLHLHAVVVVGRAEHFAARGVDVDVQMQTLTRGCEHNRVALHEPVEDYGRIATVNEQQRVIGTLRAAKVHLVTLDVDVVESVVALTTDGVAEIGGPEDEQGVVIDDETGRKGGGVGVEDTVTADLKQHLVRLAVKPYTLQTPHGIEVGSYMTALKTVADMNRTDLLALTAGR